MSGRVKPEFRSASCSDLALAVQARERQLRVARPRRVGEPLLVDRDAFGDPPRHALVRQLQREHVGQLVPHRRLPVERARRARARRVLRDDRAEAGAERADHSHQAGRADGEVVVLREDLDRDRALRVDAVAAAHLGERLRGERPGVEPEHGRLVGVHADGRDVALLRLEPVERVEHLQEVHA